MALLASQPGASWYVTFWQMRWIRKFAGEASSTLEVIQLLGVFDGVVTRRDSTDIEQFVNGYSVDVPGAYHDTVHRIDMGTPEQNDLRYAVIIGAIRDPEGHATVPHDTPNKDTVVFVLHGMRDGNDGWVEDIRGRIEAKASNALVITSSYGYLTALDYISPSNRRKYIGWFQNEYSKALARYPRATFHFVGHSNGTYILG